MKFGPFDDVVNISQADGSLLELPNANTNSHMDKAIENVREVDKNLGVEDPITDLTTPVVVGPGCIMNMEVSEHVQNQEETGLGCEVELSQCQFCYAYPSFAMLQSKQCVAMLILKFDTHLGFNVGHADNNVGQVDLALRGAWISCCGLLLCIGSGLWFLRVMSGSPALSQCFGSGLWL
ncbi:hypothetical protein U1Q18_004820 [Sarracenia purpurea var. burkii]